MERTARIHREDGSYWAEVVELPGWFASGDTLDEPQDALSEAISLNLHDDPDAAAVEGPEAVHQAVEIGELKMRVAAAASS